MYDKIYKEIFLKGYVKQKRKVFQYPEEENGNRSIWEVFVYEQRYFITVYIDDIDDYITDDERNLKEFERRNEAELAHFRTDYGENPTERRIIANRLFLELLRRFAKEADQLQNIPQLWYNSK